MSTYIPLFIVALTVLTLYFKVRQLQRDPHNPAVRAICVVLAGLAISVFIGWEPIYRAIDGATGVPNLARYLEHVAGLVAAAAIQALFLHLGSPDQARKKARRRWYTLGIVVVIMAAAFVLAPFDTEAPDDFAEVFANAPWMLEYNLAFLAYLALAMTDIFRMSARYSRQLPPSLLRFGIQMLALGAIDGLIYVAHKGLFLTLTRAGADPPWTELPVTRPLVFVGIILVAGGLVIPAVGTVLADAWHWPRRYRLYRDMYPLWEAIYRINADVNLHPPQRRPPIRRMSIALYRRVIEIRDGLRELNPYLDPSITQTADEQAIAIGCAPEVAKAIGEAAGIAAMLEYVRATPPVARTPTNLEGPESASGTAEDDRNTDARWEADATWLARVSRAYTASAIVATHRAGSPPTATS